jgi:capsular exopolysaccharide synthesis family protein
MSRIHEALKKAEQERAGQPPLDGAMSDVPITTPFSPESAPSPVSRPSSAVSQRPSALSLEMIRQWCAQPLWTPDTRHLVFAKGDDHGPGAEEFRTLRSRLFKIRERQKLRSVLVTSALPTEGKTFVASNLAQAFGRQHERRAILIDADLRKSRLHMTLGAPPTPGLTDYLRGEFDELSIIQRGPQENLCFIPGGKPASNPAELIGNGRLPVLIQKLAAVFDWIIVDSPPVIPVSDASLLAEMCDGVLMVVMADVTPYDMAQKACLEFRDKHLLGAVLNRAPQSSKYNSYYYGYSQGTSGSNGRKKG